MPRKKHIIYPIFFEKFSELFERSELSQAEFSKRIGVKQTTVSSYLTKTSEPENFDTLIRISKYFKISLYDLTGLEAFKDIEKKEVPDKISENTKKLIDNYESLSKEGKAVIESMIIALSDKSDTE